LFMELIFHTSTFLPGNWLNLSHYEDFCYIKLSFPLFT
jgi:hypothetical protein